NRIHFPSQRFGLRSHDVPVGTRTRVLAVERRRHDDERSVGGRWRARRLPHELLDSGDELAMRCRLANGPVETRGRLVEALARRLRRRQRAGNTHAAALRRRPTSQPMSTPTTSATAHPMYISRFVVARNGFSNRFVEACRLATSHLPSSFTSVALQRAG